MTTPDPDFPITWPDPSDAELTWYRDDMHMPKAMTPLAGDYVRLMGTGMAAWHERIGTPVRPAMEIWHGYAYFGARIDAPEDQHAAVWERSTEAARAQILTIDAEWRASMIPELRDHYERIRAYDVEAMPLDDLAEAWDDAWRRVARCWGIHFIAIRGAYQVLEDLADLYEAVVPSPEPGDAVGMIAGGIHELQDVERRVEDLAAMPDGPEFREALEAFLEEHGHLGQAWDDLALPSWVEEPELLLQELRKRREHPPRESFERRRARLAETADAIADRARSHLADDAERLARFEALLADSRLIGPMTESHNYWIDRAAQSALRRFVMRVGRRLVTAGVLEDANDIFFLERREVPELLRAPGDRRALVAARERELEQQTHLQPPETVGRPAPPDDGTDRFDGARFTSDVADELRGTGASAGIVRGPARVIVGEEDFERVEAGDIIVCPSSNPSWVPLFAIAGGLVTNTGGVLSHAAVVAREFGLPAVVGTGDATTRIADGRQIEIDGTTGLVRLR